MKYKPLEPGMYIVQFHKNTNMEDIAHIINNLNFRGEKYGIEFIPERTELYQIIRSEE